ncbi:MAG: metallophosphoesterase N-terminal domain-containing protein, partial [Muribaculaceae bacterium]
MKKLITMLLPAMLAASISVDAQNIVGTITCDGVGVAGVVVSDGYVVTTTNSEGYYEIASEKKNG